MLKQQSQSLLQALDSQRDQAAPSRQQPLPSVPISAQGRAQILQNLPAGAAPVAKNAADKVQSSADAEVSLGSVDFFQWVFKITSS